jgi:hypothetical protein
MAMTPKSLLVDRDDVDGKSSSRWEKRWKEEREEGRVRLGRV